MCACEQHVLVTTAELCSYCRFVRKCQLSLNTHWLYCPSLTSVPPFTDVLPQGSEWRRLCGQTFTLFWGAVAGTFWGHVQVGGFEDVETTSFDNMLVHSLFAFCTRYGVEISNRVCCQKLKLPSSSRIFDLSLFYPSMCFRLRQWRQRATSTFLSSVAFCEGFWMKTMSIFLRSSLSMDICGVTRKRHWLPSTTSQKSIFTSRFLNLTKSDFFTG